MSSGGTPLVQGLPVLVPDEAVREVIIIVFRRFDELGSARQVLIGLREDGCCAQLRRPREPVGERTRRQLSMRLGDVRAGR
jgi:hypothetical protein